MTKTCLYCGKEFESKFPTKQLCSNECKKGRHKELHERNYERIKSIRPARKEQARMRKPSISIREISKLALEEGLSYGEYVAKYKL